MSGQDNEEFWLLVVQVQLSLLVVLLIFLTLGHYSREFRFFVVWFVEEQIRGRFRRVVAGL